MYISNNSVFSDLVGTDTPSVAYTLYDPTANWGRAELVALKRGSILVQIADSGAGCFSPEIVALWYKRDENGNARDWGLITPLAAIGALGPDSSNADLAALPVGAVYVRSEGINCVDGLYIKARNNGGVGACSDWVSILLNVTRVGDELSFNGATNTLNLPLSGLLSNEGDGQYTWTPDDGSADYSFYVPLLTDNADGTFTYDPRNGGSPITINTNSSVVIPADISAVRRPWVQVGAAQATNATNVTEANEVFHTGGMIRGASAFGTTGTVGAELMGNNALGAGNHVMTSAENSTIGGGSSNDNKNTKRSFIGAGTDNVIDGVTNPDLYNENFIGAGNGNSNAGQRAGIVSGNGNQISNAGLVSFIGGGYQNQANGQGAGVVGGYFNRANALMALALGMKCNITHSSAILLNTHLGADPNTATDLFASAADGELAMRTSGVRLFTNLAQSAGMTMAAGASAWVAVSDARAKQDIQPVDHDALAGYKVLQPVSYFMGEPVAVGITAQNFYEAFPFLEEKQVGDFVGVSQAERDGVQDLAIKQLLARVEALEARLAQYEGE